MPRPVVVLLTTALALATQQDIASARVENAWLILVDDLHIDFVQTGRLRTLLRAIADEVIQDGDSYQLRVTGPSNRSGSMPTAFSTDRGLLPPAIRFVYGSGLKLIDALNVSLAPAPNELFIRANRSLDAAESALSMLAAEEAGRKAIVLISSGHDVDMFRSVADRVAALTARARDSRVTIFAIDARGLTGPPVPEPQTDLAAWRRYVTSTRLSLTMMTESTGGFVVEKVYEPRADLQRISAQMR